MSKYQDLLGCLDVIMQMDMDQYTILKGWEDLPRPNVLHLSEKAAFIQTDSLPGNGAWLPFSTMRCDTEGNLYLKDWKYKQQGGV